MLPTKEWIARITPENTLEEIEPENLPPSPTVWNDEFDNVFVMPDTSKYRDLSRKQLCRMQKNAALRNESIQSYHGAVRDIAQRETLLIDDCFVSGIVEGFDAVLMVAFMLGLIAIAAMAIRLRLQAWSLRRRVQLADVQLPQADSKTEV